MGTTAARLTAWRRTPCQAGSGKGAVVWDAARFRGAASCVNQASGRGRANAEPLTMVTEALRSAVLVALSLPAPLVKKFWGGAVVRVVMKGGVAAGAPVSLSYGCEVVLLEADHKTLPKPE